MERTPVWHAMSAYMWLSPQKGLQDVGGGGSRLFDGALNIGGLFIMNQKDRFPWLGWHACELGTQQYVYMMIKAAPRFLGQSLDSPTQSQQYNDAFTKQYKVGYTGLLCQLSTSTRQSLSNVMHQRASTRTIDQVCCIAFCKIQNYILCVMK